MTPEEVGRKVKTQYPQYASMSDEEVGKKTLEKYPKYGEAEGEKPLYQKVARTVSDAAPVVGGIIGGVAGTAIGAPSGPGALLTGAAGTAAGTGSGLAFGEIVENFAGIQDESTQELARESIQKPLTAGAVDLAFGAGAKALGWGAGKMFDPVRKVLKGGVDMVGEEVAKRFHKASPTAWRKAMQEHGMDLYKLIKDNIPAGSKLDTVLGPVEERGKGGLFKQMFGEQEKIISRVIGESGDVVISTADDFVKVIDGQIDELSDMVGNAPVIESLKTLKEEALEMYKDGLTAKQLLKIKRAADSAFGKNVVEETTGSVAAQVQKLFGNEARAILKKEFGSIKGALEKETELYVLRPILEHSRAIGRTQGSLIRKGGIELTKPGTWVDPLLNNEQIQTNLIQGQLPGVPGAAQFKTGVKQLLRPLPQVAREMKQNEQQKQETFPKHLYK